MLRFLTAFPLLVGVLALPPKAESSSKADGPRSYRFWNKLPFFSCKIGRRFYNWDTCEGYPKHDLATAGDTLAAWARNRSWHKVEDEIKRRPAVTGDSIILRPRAIVDPDEYRLPELANIEKRGLLIGRITVDAAGSADHYYGVGGPKYAGYAPDFYFIVDKIATGGRVDSARVERGHWTLYGVKDGRLQPTSVQGTLWECRHTHASDIVKKGATFANCEKMSQLLPILGRPAVRRLIGNAPIMTALRTGVLAAKQSTALTASLATLLSPAEFKIIEEAVVQSFEAPFWTACGTGCCTAEM